MDNVTTSMRLSFFLWTCSCVVRVTCLIEIAQPHPIAGAWQITRALHFNNARATKNMIRPAAAWHKSRGRLAERHRMITRPVQTSRHTSQITGDLHAKQGRSVISGLTVSLQRHLENENAWKLSIVQQRFQTEVVRTRPSQHEVNVSTN